MESWQGLSSLARLSWRCGLRQGMGCLSPIAGPGRLACIRTRPSNRSVAPKRRPAAAGTHRLLELARTDSSLLDCLSSPVTIAFFVRRLLAARQGALTVVVLGATAKAEERVLRETVCTLLNWRPEPRRREDRHVLGYANGAARVAALLAGDSAPAAFAHCAPLHGRPGGIGRRTESDASASERHDDFTTPHGSTSRASISSGQVRQR